MPQQLFTASRSAADADHERSIAMFLHAIAAVSLKASPGITIKWVAASELSVADDGVVQDGDGVRVRCVWKSASWRNLCSYQQTETVERLLFSPEVQVYQASRVLAEP